MVSGTPGGRWWMSHEQQPLPLLEASHGHRPGLLGHFDPRSLAKKRTRFRLSSVLTVHQATTSSRRNLRQSGEALSSASHPAERTGFSSTTCAQYRAASREGESSHKDVETKAPNIRQVLVQSEVNHEMVEGLLNKSFNLCSTRNTTLSVFCAESGGKSASVM